MRHGRFTGMRHLRGLHECYSSFQSVCKSPQHYADGCASDSCWQCWLQRCLSAAVFAAQYAIVRFQPGMMSNELRAWMASAQQDEQQKQQAYLRKSLDTMAMHLGQMQAQVLRLDGLGSTSGQADRHETAGVLVRQAARTRRTLPAGRPAAGGFADQHGTTDDGIECNAERSQRQAGGAGDHADAGQVEQEVVAFRGAHQGMPGIPPILAGASIRLPARTPCTKAWITWFRKVRPSMPRPAAWWCMRTCIRSMVIWSRLITAIRSSRVMRMPPN